MVSVFAVEEEIVTTPVVLPLRVIPFPAPPAAMVSAPESAILFVVNV